MLCKEFAEVLQLAVEQQVVWKLHQELPGEEGHSLEGKSPDHHFAVGDDRMFDRICGSDSGCQSNPALNRYRRLYTHPVYANFEAMKTRMLSE